MHIQLYEPLPFNACCDTCGMMDNCSIAGRTQKRCEDYIPSLELYSLCYTKFLYPRVHRLIAELAGNQKPKE